MTEMDTTRIGAVAAGTLSADFLLPGRWWHVDLSAPAGVPSQVRAMAREVVGRQDDRTRLRHDIQTSVERAALAAANARASDFYFAIEVVPGVPIPVCLAVYWPDVPVGIEAGATLAAAAEAVAAGLRHGQTGAQVENFGGTEIAVVRSVKTMVGPSLAAAGVEGARELLVSYWLMRQSTPRPLLLSFTSPMLSMKDEFLPLFDAIVSTTAWSDNASDVAIRTASDETQRTQQE